MPKEHLVLYHGNCYDGFGAAYAAWLKYPNAEFVPVLYGQPPPDVTGRTVCILDFSYPRDVLLRMKEQAAFLKVLDHHTTGKEALADLDFAEFSDTECGAVMAWKYFHTGNPVPKFFLYLQDRDLWKFELPESREVSAALRSFPFDFDVWDKLVWDVALLKADGRAILRLNEQIVALTVARRRMIVLAGVEMPVVNTSWLFSECAEAMVAGSPNGMAAYYFDLEDQRQWGLRSAPGVDCSVVAKFYGGGGHAEAAGFTSAIGWLPADSPSALNTPTP